MEIKSKVALCMIARNKEDVIVRALDSTKDIFDLYCLQDTGSTDQTIEKFEKWCKDHGKPYEVGRKFLNHDYDEDGLTPDDHPGAYRSILVDGKPTLADFASARNDSFALIAKYELQTQTPIKYAFWIDTDDVLENAQQIPIAVEIADKMNLDQWIMVYDYARSVDGLKPVTQKRERLINLQKKGAWRNWVHENYVFEEVNNYALPDVMAKYGLNISITHMRTAYEAAATNRRNNLIMKLQMEELGLENFPDEMLAHLAFDCWEHREYEESITHYKTLLERYQGKQVHPEMMLQVLLKLSNSYIELKHHDEAMKYIYQAIAIAPGLADGYLLAAEAYVEVQNWDQVEHYAQKVLDLGKPNTTAPINEYDYVVVPRRLLMQVKLMRNDLPGALKLAGELKQILGSNTQVKTEYYGILKEQRRQNAIRAIGELSLYLQENNRVDFFERLRAAIPLELLEDDTVRMKIKELRHDEKRKLVNRRYHDNSEKTIIFFAGQGYENWDGESDTKKGIGGSEGMCIQLAHELSKLGNKVFVYNDCGISDGKVFDGVTYIDFRKWSPSTKCDIFVSLRRPDVFGALIKANKCYLWLHDTDYGEIPLNLWTAPNKVIVLSDYHKDIIKLNHGLSDDSLFHVTRNAINPDAVAYADKHAGKRDPYQIIYGSSYDRGLDHFIEVMKRVNAEIPEAHGKIFYGWDTMDSMIKMHLQAGSQRGVQLQQYKAHIIDLIKNTPCVTEFGRVSQKELYKHFAESGIWLYPTEFTEISCITAMTAQAMGAIPVCTPVAALNETVSSKFGIKTDIESMAQSIIYLLNNEKETEKRRKKMIEWARAKYDMAELAKEWNTFFNED